MYSDDPLNLEQSCSGRWTHAEDLAAARTFRRAPKTLTMERQPYQGDQYEIVQQGPELQDSPRSERGADSPRVCRANFFDAGADMGARNSAGSSRSHSATTSPSLPKRAVAVERESETEDARLTPRRSQNCPPLSQLRSDFARQSDPSSQYIRQQQQLPQSAPYCQLATASDLGSANESRAAYFYGPSVSQQAPYVYHQTAVYPAPPPHYFYATVPHVPAPHPYMVGPTPTAPPPGTWIYAPPPLFSPPAATSSPAHHHFAAFAPVLPAAAPRTLQDSGTCTDDQLLYGGGDDETMVVFRRQSPRQSPARAREYGDDYGGRADSYESKEGEAETSPAHSYSSAYTNRYHTGAKLEKEHGRTPLFGERPSWWGREEEEEENYKDEHSVSAGVRSEIEHARLSAVRASGRQPEYASDTEAIAPFKRTSGYQSSGEQSSETPNRHRSSIRMEVSLNDVPSPVDERPERDSDTKPRRSECATAFTIEFAKENESAARTAALDKARVAERNWKTQSAERLHRNFVRRSVRKGEGVVADPSPKPQQPAAKPPVIVEKPKTAPPPSGKTYLLEKMLSSAAAATTAVETTEEPATSPVAASGVVSRSEDSLATTPSGELESSQRRESDACSDAGTYVVDRDEDDSLEARLKIDQVFGVDRIAEEWNDDVDDRNRTPSPASSSRERSTVAQPVITPRLRNQNPIQQRAANEKSTTGSAEEDEEKRRKGLLKRLIKTNAASAESARVGVVKPPPTPASVSAAAPKPPSSAAPPTRENASFQARRAAAINKRASFGTGASNRIDALNRIDAGRYSMRSSSVSGADRSTTTAAAVASKALSKTVSSAAAPKATAAAPKESETMKLWLRRKEYNPMKAAADAKKSKAVVRQRAADDGAPKANDEPVYLSNRSRSFHLGTVLAEASSAPLKKHPSLHDAGVRDFGRGDEEEDDDDGIGVVSESAAARGSALDEESLERLASLSHELGRRAERVLTRVNGRAGRSTDALHEMDARRNSDKEAALAALLNQLRVASRALEEVDRILPDEPENETRTASSRRPAATTKLKAARPCDNSDV